MNYINKLKEMFWWENILIKTTNEKFIDLFTQYKQYSKDVYIVPLQDLDWIISAKKTEDRDYCFFTTDKWYWPYQYDHSIYEYKFKWWWWRTAFTIYKKKNSYDVMYNKMIDEFKKLYLNNGNIDKAMQEAFEKVTANI